ncbi:hypothetical protein JCM10207_000170 [Rhodosporidiobolus poonsookiae]
MSADLAQPCSICGTKTTTRCSSCGAAGADIFFCSKDCQRAIWSAHKQICGARANPFQWPPLSPEEVEDAIKHLGTRHELGEAKLTLGDVLSAMLLAPRREHADIIRTLGTPNPAPNLVPPGLVQIALFKVRTVEYSRIVSSMSFNLPAPAPTRNNNPNRFQTLVSVFVRFLTSPRELETGTPTSERVEKWYTGYAHRALAYFTLREEWRLQPWREEFRAYHEWTKKELQRYIREEVVKIEPARGRKMQEFMRTLPPLMCEQQPWR